MNEIGFLIENNECDLVADVGIAWKDGEIFVAGIADGYEIHRFEFLL